MKAKNVCECFLVEQGFQETNVQMHTINLKWLMEQGNGFYLLNSLDAFKQKIFWKSNHFPSGIRLCKEQCWMIINLIGMGVPSPVVGSILFQGNKMTTYKTDLKYPQTYKSMELASILLPSNLQAIDPLLVVL